MSTNTTSNFGYILVGIQFVCLGIILLGGDFFVTQPIYFSFQLLGVLVGVWAIRCMNIKKINVVPTPRNDMPLVVVGPYQYIRHPMYLAVLLFAVPAAVYTRTWWSWVAALILLIDLLIKLHYEEVLLKKHFSNYSQYTKHTKKLIPFVY